MDYCFRYQVYCISKNENLPEHFVEYNPYRQIYFEFSNWDKKDKFNYHFGYDFYHEYLPDKTILAKTAPLQFVYKFDKGNSITIYVEMQDKWQNHKKYYYWYFAPSYNHFGKWSITLFSDNPFGTIKLSVHIGNRPFVLISIITSSSLLLEAGTLTLV